MRQIRIQSGFIEFNGDRIAQILPNVHEWAIRDDLECLIDPDDVPEVYTESEMEDAKEEAFSDGEDEANDKIDGALDRLLRRGDISEEVHDLIVNELV